MRGTTTRIHMRNPFLILRDLESLPEFRERTTLHACECVRHNMSARRELGEENKEPFSREIIIFAATGR